MRSFCSILEYVSVVVFFGVFVITMNNYRVFDRFLPKITRSVGDDIKFSMSHSKASNFLSMLECFISAT